MASSSIPTATSEIETGCSEVQESDDTDGDDIGSSAIKKLFHTSSNLILHPFLISKDLLWRLFSLSIMNHGDTEDTFCSFS
jgi:hypothetical protein